MAANPTPQRIDIFQWALQWDPLPHKFSLNVWNFEVLLGQEAVSIFQKSFDLKKFNSANGMKWVQRRKRNKGGNVVGSLVESGSLKHSIKYQVIPSSNPKKTGVKIYTDPKAFAHTYRHPGFCFAAVHNEPDSAGTRTGAAMGIPQRKFMGHSTVLSRKMRQLEKQIFSGFPI